MNPRTLVIGDIHGSLRALEQLINRVGLSPDDRLIFLGDYVDGWSQSAQVIDFLIALKKKHNCIFIRGNHDIWCESWLRGETPQKVWLNSGGEATIASYSELSHSRRTAHLEFFQNLYNYYVDEQNRLFIHGGFCSMDGPAKEYHESTFFLDRTLWNMALEKDSYIRGETKLYPRQLLLFKEIFIGHTPTLNYGIEVPMQGCNVWNLDTGAAYYGKLSALDADTKQYWQSDTVKQFYPTEKGRNK